MIYSSLKKEVESFQTEMIRFTQDLVRTPSTSLQEAEVAALVEGKLRELEFDLVVHDEIGNVVGAVSGGDPRFTIVLNSHIDTTQPKSVEGWLLPPFSGDILEGRIFGVGASDCKGGVAAQVFAARAIARTVPSLNGNVIVAATVAEENGCSLGVRHLFRHTLPRIGMTPRFVILGEPTGLDVGCGHDGWARFNIDVMGVERREVEGVAHQIFDRLALVCDTPGQPRQGRLMGAEPPALMVCTECFIERVEIVRRLFAGETITGIIERLSEDVVNGFDVGTGVVVEIHLHEELQHPASGCGIRVPLMTRPWFTDLGHPLVERAREALIAAGFAWTPGKWALDRLGTGTAGSFITSEIGIPAIGFGPGEESQDLCSGESVGIASLLEAAYGTAAITYGLIGSPLEGVH